MISFGILAVFLAASAASADETATQQQIDKLSGAIQDFQEYEVKTDRRLDALEKEIGDLRDKVNAPVVNDYATHQELKDLVDKMQEIDQKRKEDTENIARQIENLAKAAAAAPAITPTPVTHAHSTSRPEADDTAAAPSTPDKGYEYVVQPGDNLGLIIKAYKEKGVKVKKSQIIAANPKMNPNVLLPHEKIFIPDASAK